MPEKNSKWISVTGIDGCGKTTIAKYLTHALSGKASFFKFPSEKWVNDALILSGGNRPGVDRYTDLLIFATSNRLDDYWIRKLLKINDFVVSQRSWLDMYPYHISKEYSYQKLTEILKPTDLLVPDTLVFLRCGYRKAYDRIKHMKSDKFETRDLMKMHERNFEDMLCSIYSGAFPVDVHKMVIIEQDSNKGLDYVKSELDEKLSITNII